MNESNQGSAPTPDDFGFDFRDRVAWRRMRNGATAVTMADLDYRPWLDHGGHIPSAFGGEVASV